MVRLVAEWKPGWKDWFKREREVKTAMPAPRFFLKEEIAAMESVPGAYPSQMSRNTSKSAEEVVGISELTELLETSAETISKLRTVIEAREKELKSCVNELCHRCGRCENEHLGTCKDCRWLPIRNGGMKRDTGADATS